MDLTFDSLDWPRQSLSWRAIDWIIRAIQRPEHQKPGTCTLARRPGKFKVSFIQEHKVKLRLRGSLKFSNDCAYSSLGVPAQANADLQTSEAHGYYVLQTATTRAQKPN